MILRVAKSRSGPRPRPTAILILTAVFAMTVFAATAHARELGFNLQRVSADSFDDPDDVVLAPTGTHLYVADVDNDVIKVVHPFTLQTLTVIGKGSLDDPHGVAFGDDRLMYVADTGNNRIVSYRVKHNTAVLAGTYQKGFNGPGGVDRLEGRLYVVNTSDNAIIIRERDGRTTKLAQSGDQPGEFNKPSDIIVAPEGYILVADTGNNRIQILSQALEPLKILQGAPYNFDGPRHMALDEAGNLFVADTGNNRILVLDAEFNIVGQIGTGDSGRLDGPRGVTAHGGRVWVSNTGNDRILLYQYSIR